MVFKRALSQTLATLIPFLNQAELRNVYNQATEIQDEMLRGEALGILTASGKLQTGNRHNMVDGAITAAANSRPSHTGVQDDPTYPTPIVESSADQSDIKFWERLFKQQDERIIKGAQALELQIGSQPLTTQDKTAIPNDVFSQRAINEPLIQWMIRLRPQLKALLSPKSLELIDDTLDATPASVHLSRVKEQVFRLGKLGILTVYAPYISDAKLCMEVEDSLDKENLADQLLLLENI